MQYDLEPGNFVINPSQKSWGIGQVQSIIRNKATINFQNVGKQVINLDIINYLKVLDKDGNEVEITSLENVIENSEGFEVVQIDVEPLDVYFGSTFLVHNKGSNSDPF